MSGGRCNYIGSVGEAEVAAELTAAGFHVYAPVFHESDADLIAERNGHMIRVQVKTLAGEGPMLRFLCQTNSTTTYIGSVDWLALRSLHHGVTAFLKPQEAGVRPTIRYEASKRYKVIPSQRLAKDYTIDRVIKETDT